ncbi:hypothetical protein AX769_07410 [Frondihabitans sp. PAMC 28766]|nr:hypothetical protein AX769_07410 [Frondihabitans sp. PAMC 28766]
MTLTDGTVLTEQVDTPKGEPANPMSPAEIGEKFRRLTTPVLGSAGALLLEEEFLSLRGAADLTRLGRALAGALV